MRPLVSIITVTHDLPHELQVTLCASLAARPQGIEVIVHDNASRPESVNSLRSAVEATGGKFIACSENVGFGEACNRAAHEAQAPVLFFLNPDCGIAPEIWPKIVEAAGRISSGMVKAVQPMVLRTSDGRVDTLGEQLFNGGAACKIGEGWTVAEAEENIPHLIHSLYDGLKAGPSGAAFLISQNAFWAVGGFDGRFFLMKEDTDLAIRLVHARVVTQVDLSIRVSHAVSVTINRMGATKSYLAMRNYFYALYRNFSLMELVRWSFWIALQKVFLMAYHGGVKRHPVAALKALWVGSLLGLNRLRDNRRLWRAEVHPLCPPLPYWVARIRKLKS